MSIPSSPKSPSSSASSLSSADASVRSTATGRGHAQLVGRLEQIQNKLDSFGLISGDDAIAISGLVAEHAGKLADYASRNDVWIAFRPVNRHSTSLIAEGAAVKGLDDTHLKSASTGPMAGFIPIDQRLSKNAAQLIKNLPDDHHASVDTSKPGIVAAPLKITEARKNELAAKSIIRPAGEPGTLECGNPTFIQDQAINSAFKFRLIDQPDGLHLVQYKPSNSDSGAQVWKNVEVVSKLAGENLAPIHLTADYDLHAIMPNIANLGSSRLPYCFPLPSKSQPLGNKLRELLQAKKEGVIGTAEFRHEAIIKGVLNTARNRLIGQAERARPSAVTGASNRWQKAVIDDLNKLLRPENYDEGGQLIEGSSGELIKHGTEMDNPHPEEDETILFVSPLGKSYLTQSLQQVQQVTQLAKEFNYLHYENRHTQTAQANNLKLNESLKVQQIPQSPNTRAKLPIAGQIDSVDRRHSGLLTFLNSAKSDKHKPISRAGSDVSGMSVDENSSSEFTTGFSSRSGLPRINLDSQFEQAAGKKEEG